MNKRPRFDRLIEAQSKILETPPVGDDQAYLHAIFAHVSLPRKRVKESVFERKHLNHWLLLQAGKFGDGEKLQQAVVPFGAGARLLLIALCTLSKRQSAEVINAGVSGSHFLRLLGLDGQGARHKMLQLQMDALCAARFQFFHAGQTTNSTPVHVFRAGLPKGRRRWPEQITLSRDFVTSLETHAMPIDWRAVRALAHSPLGLDIYVWLAHRLHRLPSGGVQLTWRALKAQFGHEYVGKYPVRDFASRFRVALKSVLSVYPQAKVTIGADGIHLHRSSAPVPPKRQKKEAVDDRA